MYMYVAASNIYICISVCIYIFEAAMYQRLGINSSKCAQQNEGLTKIWLMDLSIHTCIDQ